MIFSIVLLILFLDQISKSLAVKTVSLHQSIPVIKGFFYITLVHNRGAAFGILKNHAYLFIAISIFAIILISLTLLSRQRHKITSLYTISLGLILAGAAGNLIDRISLGYVIDFLDFRIWPVFNVADSAISVGAVLLGWGILFGKQRKVYS